MNFDAFANAASRVARLSTIQSVCWDKELPVFLFKHYFHCIQQWASYLIDRDLWLNPYQRRGIFPFFSLVEDLRLTPTDEKQELWAIWEADYAPALTQLWSDSPPNNIRSIPHLSNYLNAYKVACQAFVQWELQRDEIDNLYPDHPPHPYEIFILFLELGGWAYGHSQGYWRIQHLRDVRLYGEPWKMAFQQQCYQAILDLRQYYPSDYAPNCCLFLEDVQLNEIQARVRAEENSILKYWSVD